MIRHIITISLAAITLLLSRVANSDTIYKEIPLNDGSRLLVQYPHYYSISSNEKTSAKNPTISMKHSRPSNGEFLLTCIKIDDSITAQKEEEIVTNTVNTARTLALAQSKENELPINHLEGTSNYALYYGATDKKPKDNEYKYMVQGAIYINHLLSSFTILANSPDDVVINDALSLLRTATRNTHAVTDNTSYELGLKDKDWLLVLKLSGCIKDFEKTREDNRALMASFSNEKEQHGLSVVIEEKSFANAEEARTYYFKGREKEGDAISLYLRGPFAVRESTEVRKIKSKKYYGFHQEAFATQGDCVIHIIITHVSENPPGKDSIEPFLDNISIRTLQKKE